MMRCVLFFLLAAFWAVTAQTPESAWQRIHSHFDVPEAFAGDFGAYRSPLIMNDGTPVTNGQQWPGRRQELLATWQTALGPWPEVIESPKLEVLSHSDRQGIQQKRIRLEIAPDQTGDGWLLVPASTSPLPAVLVVFYDPETSVGLKPGKTDCDFAWQLAQRGFVTLSIGTPGGDAYHPDIGQAHCQPLAFHAYVAANCWQALAHLPEVDSQRIGIVGHSYGGKWSMFAAALWDKFAAVATSDPGIMFDDTRPSINYFEPWYLGRDPAITRKPGLPSMDNPTTGAYRALRSSGHDLHEVHALICPRPFLVSGGSEDPVERWRALNHSVAVNKLLGCEKRVGMTNRPEHSPNGQSNAVVVDFFTHFLIDQGAR